MAAASARSRGTGAELLLAARKVALQGAVLLHLFLVPWMEAFTVEAFFGKLGLNLSSVLNLEKSLGL